MPNRGGWRETFGGILFFFLWPLYIPYLILKWLFKLVFVRPLKVLGLDGPLRAGYVRTVGWGKMKLGLWQPIGYSPAYSEPKYDYVPRWVKKAAEEKIGNRPPGDYTINLNGRSLRYRVKYRLHGQKMYNVRTYRKLRTPLYRRVISKLNPLQ